MDSSNFLFNPVQLPKQESNILPNSSKIVDISLNKSGTTEETSWRYNLSRLYSQIDSVEGIDLSFFNVDEDINLSLDSFPELGTSPEYGSLKDGLSDVLDAIPGIGGNIAKIIKSPLASALTNLAVSGKDAFTNQGEGAAAGSAFNPWFFNVPAWSPSDASTIDFTIKFSFNMGQFGLWSAVEEVYKPVINLVAPVLFRKNGDLTTTGPGPNMITLLVSFAEKIFTTDSDKEKTTEDGQNTAGTGQSTNGEPSATTEEETNFLTDALNKLSAIINETYSGYIYKVKIGNFVEFSNAILTGATVTWGTEVDNYGYPTSANVDVSIKTISPPALTNSQSFARAIRYGGN